MRRQSGFRCPSGGCQLLRCRKGLTMLKRQQYQSVEIMKLLARSAPRDASRVLGVTDVDLAIPMLSFLFGQAQFDGPVAMVSLCRLRQEFYGLPRRTELLRERT